MSRLVTKNRYVEVLNGRIKKTFQYFDKTIQNFGKTRFLDSTNIFPLNLLLTLVYVAVMSS